MAAPVYWNEFLPQLDTSGIHTAACTASDGCRLYAFELGRRDGPALVIVNPLATPFLLMLPLARLLGSFCRVVSWETRSSPFLGECGGEAGTVDRHADDFSEVLRQLDVGEFHLLTWCTGAIVAARAHRKLGLPILSAACVAPEKAAIHAEPTPFQTGFMPLVEQVASDVAAGRDASMACAMIQSAARMGHDRLGSDPLLRGLTMLNLRTPESILAHVGQIQTFNRSLGVEHGAQQTVEHFRHLQRTVPSLLAHCMDDRVVDYRCSVEATEAVASSKLVLYGSGGHFVPYGKPRAIGSDIAGFLDLHAVRGARAAA